MKPSISNLDWGIPHLSEFGVVVFHDTLWDVQPNASGGRPDMGVPRFVEELRAQGYPVITLDQNFGVSLVQPTVGGIRLSGPASGHPEAKGETTRPPNR